MRLPAWVKDRRRFVHGEDGATAVEYALIAALIAAVVAGIVTVLGQEVLALFASVNWW